MRSKHVHAGYRVHQAGHRSQAEHKAGRSRALDSLNSSGTLDMQRASFRRSERVSGPTLRQGCPPFAEHGRLRNAFLVGLRREANGNGGEGGLLGDENGRVSSAAGG